MLTSSRFVILYPNPNRSDSADVPRDIGAIVTAIEASAAMFGQGTLAARPTSTGGSPGKQGRFYMATDQSPMALYYDYGTGWASVGSVAAGSIGTTQLADHSVTTIKIAADAVTATEIAAGAVGASELAAGAVVAAAIANALKPSAGAGGGTEALRALGTAAGTAAAGTHATQHGRTGADPIDMSTYNMSGTLAARPAAGAVANGVRYLATDTNGGTEYLQRAGAWSQASMGVNGQDLTAYATLASPTFTGTVTLAALLATGAVTINGILQITAAAPGFRMFENDQALDEGMWEFRASSGQLLLETRHDDGTVGTTLMQVLGRVGAGINPNVIDFVNVHLRNKGLNVLRHGDLTQDRHEEAFSGTSATLGQISFTYAHAFTAAPWFGTGSTDPDITLVVNANSTTGMTVQTRAAANPATPKNVNVIVHGLSA